MTTPSPEFEMQIAQELGVSLDQLLANESMRRVWERLVQVEFSRRPNGGPLIEEAMRRSEEHADPEWKRRFGEAIVTVAEAREYLTSDDVLAYVENLPDPPKTHDLSAIGPAMMSAKKDGVIEASGRLERSQRTEKNGNRHTVWHSKIYKGGGNRCLF